MAHNAAVWVKDAIDESAEKIVKFGLSPLTVKVDDSTRRQTVTAACPVVDAVAAPKS